MLDCQIDDNGIATLTLDMPDRSMNVINKAVFDAIVQQIDAHAAKPDVKGFIVTSGKPAFAAGADVSELDRLGDPDVPVERIDPIASYYATVSRMTVEGTRFYPDQKMTRMEALRSYTLNNAYAEFAEDRKGSITPGKLADLTVLSQDILTIPEERIPQTQVELTVVGGEIRYRRKEDGP